MSENVQRNVHAKKIAPGHRKTAGKKRDFDTRNVNQYSKNQDFSKWHDSTYQKNKHANGQNKERKKQKKNNITNSNL